MLHQKIATVKKNYSYKNSVLVEKFINLVMMDGKKSKANKILFSALQIVKKKHVLIVSDKNYKLEKRDVNKNKVESELIIEKQHWKKKSPNDGFSLLNQIIDQVTPCLEIRNVRIGRKTYQVPAVISKKRQQNLAIRWILDSARKRKQKTKKSFSDCLAQEFIDALQKQGGARQKRDELYRLVQGNRANIHYRWW